MVCICHPFLDILLYFYSQKIIKQNSFKRFSIIVYFYITGAILFYNFSQNMVFPFEPVLFYGKINKTLSKDDLLIMNILFIIFLFLFQLFTFFAFGSFFLRLFKKNLPNFSIVLISGFLYYFIFFALFAWFCIFTFQSLSLLTYSWMGFSLIITALSAIFNFKIWMKRAFTISQTIRLHNWCFPILIISIIIQMMFVFTHIDTSADASYYVGKVTTDVYTNTLGQFDPYTGEKLLSLDSRRAIACFPEYNAVISYFFGIHPLQQAKLILPELMILLTNIIYYQIGLLLFDADRKKADGMVFFIFLLNLYSYTQYTSSTFLLTRTYEGKSILANIIIPGIIFCFLIIWKKGHILLCKLLLLGFSLSSCIFSSSSMMIVPVALTAGILPWIVKEKKWGTISWYVLYLLPNLIICVLYLLSSRGYLVYTIH